MGFQRITISILIAMVLLTGCVERYRPRRPVPEKGPPGN